MQISFEEFIKEAKANVDAFEQYWKENNHANPEIFPMEMDEDNVGMWWEQLYNFDDGSD